MNQHKGIHELGLIYRILGVLGDEPSHKNGTVHKHILIGGGRTTLECLPPVRDSLVITFLLEVLLVERKILDTVRAVSAILSLSENTCRTQGHYDRRNY